MSSTLGLQELLKTSFNDSIVAVNETAPYTTIQNRAKVTRSLKAVAGNERVMVKSVNKLNLEFGPNGEAVYEADNKDARIRFVGIWVNQSDISGTRPYTSTTNSYVEVTFYGTGLNILTTPDGVAPVATVSIDGSAAGSNIFSPLPSGVLNSRYAGSNIVMNLVSNLTLGLHTAKILCSTANLNVFGFEILNQRSDIGVYPGTAIADGNIVGLSSLTSSSFKDGIVGTRGGRVVKYLDGTTIKSAVQEVDSSSKYLTLADHTNEEVLRRVNFREFGAGRTDDFSTLSTARAAAFTLDDGTTTLVTNNGLVATYNSVEGIGWGATTNFITLTFVGTGLDLNYTAASLSSVVITTSIDGTSIGSPSFSNGVYRTQICSGLPYGTHTVKFTYTSGTGNLYLTDFIIYQPKKPSIPDGTIEIADYNVMADYITSSSPALGYIGSGVLRKALSVREAIYTGTWALQSGTDTTNFESAFNNSATATSSTVTYSFYGTGFEWRGYCGANLTNSTISVDSSSNLSGFTTSFAQSSSGLTFTSSTGILTGTSAAANRIKIQVSGLALGWHTVKWTTNSAINFYSDILDIITPIHINSTDLKTGSLALKSNSAFSPVVTNKTKWQKKVLAADITVSSSSSAIIPSLCFNNLVVGATYRVTLNMRATWQNGVNYNDSLSLQAVSGSSLLLNIINNRYATTGYANEFGAGESVCFVATSPTLTVQWATGAISGSNVYIRGGADYYTFATLEQLPNHVQTFEW